MDDQEQLMDDQEQLMDDQKQLRIAQEDLRSDVGLLKLDQLKFENAQLQKNYQSQLLKGQTFHFPILWKIGSNQK